MFQAPPVKLTCSAWRVHGVQQQASVNVFGASVLQSISENQITPSGSGGAAPADAQFPNTQFGVESMLPLYLVLSWSPRSLLSQTVI